jgi:hypothetical protein
MFVFYSNSLFYLGCFVVFVIGTRYVRERAINGSSFAARRAGK